MPIYEYMCGDCGARAEAIQKVSDAPLTTCPTCGQDALNRVVSAPSFTFKGSGWYITDYSAKGRQESASSKNECGAKGECGAKSERGAAGATSCAGEKTTSDAKPSTQAA